MNATDIPFARPSSTVILTRDGEKAPEFCLVRRHEQATFGGAYVFPGGVVDEADHSIDRRCVDIDPADADRILNVQGEGLGYYVAAVRELFEEAGVLIANEISCDDELDAVRRALNSGALQWNRFVSEQRLRLACSTLRYFSHWITPDVIPKRFSTRFFLARMPDAQHACHDDGEVTDTIWTTADHALESARDGRLKLHFPTIKTIENLARFPTVDDLEDWASRCEKSGVVAIQPVMPGGDPKACPEIRDIRQGPFE
ncbi:MAG: NUDIX hydrolase [Woeseiaceae bacterium]|nr:NUDIX hydrolase [Woeseiaceae bacterium]